MIFTKDFFNLISNFGEEWVITKIEADHLNKVAIIILEYNGEKYFEPRTEEESTLYDHAPDREWRHLDIWHYKTYVRCRLPRVKCKDGKVRTIRYGWADHHDRHTYSFEIKVIDTLRATKNQSKTAELLGCSFRVVNRIIHQCTERGLERRDLQKAPISHISIDEKSFKKGHQYVTVISHPGSGCVLEVGEGRDTNSVIRMLYKTFSINQLSNILMVSMDMWKAYIKSIKKILPKAEIVHDKFHLIKYLNETIDKVRNERSKKMKYLKGVDMLY